METKPRPMNPEQFLMQRQKSFIDVDVSSNPREHKLEEMMKGIVQEYAVLGDDMGEYNTVHSACFSPDDKYIACAKSNGEIIVYNVEHKSESFIIRNKERKIPYTMIKWRGKTDSFNLNNVVGTVNSDGQIQHFHISTGKCISTIQEDFGEESQINAFDYSYNFTKQAVCGVHPSIRVYDLETSKMSHNLEGSQSVGDTGHTNRVFSVRFYPNDDKMLVSGGWDNKIVFWDLRQEKPAYTLLNKMICGDSIDIKNQYMLSCSWQEKDPIQIHELHTYKAATGSHGEEGIPWDPVPNRKKKRRKQEDLKETNRNVTCLCTCRFDRNGKFILAGGAYKNEARVFNEDQVICKITGLVKPVITCDWSHNNDKFLIGGADGFVRIFSIDLDKTYLNED